MKSNPQNHEGNKRQEKTAHRFTFDSKRSRFRHFLPFINIQMCIIALFAKISIQTIKGVDFCQSRKQMGVKIPWKLLGKPVCNKFSFKSQPLQHHGKTKNAKEEHSTFHQGRRKHLPLVHYEKAHHKKGKKLADPVTIMNKLCVLQMTDFM